MALTKHEIQRRLLKKSIGNASSGDSALTDPDFIVTNVDGVVAAGAKAIKFTIPAGTTLTVKGKSVPTDLATLEWQFNPGGYSEVPYTVSGGQVIITFSR